MSFIVSEHTYGKLKKDHAALKEAVLRVIDAGRPHPATRRHSKTTVLGCCCAQCTAWDALKKALDA